MGKIASKKVEIDGHLFDSQTEAEFYMYLKSRKDVQKIELQPQFILLDEFYISCSKCVDGKVTSTKTGNLINCKTCKGTGERKRRSWTYTADFRVTWIDGIQMIIDVKGHANERFPLVKKMFEYKNGYELLVVKKTKRGWEYA